MIRKAIAAGIRGAVRHPGLTILSWLWTLTLASLLALPAFTLLLRALGSRRAAGDALAAFNLRLLFDVFHYDRTSIAALAMASLVALGAAAAVAGAFIAGGIVHTLVASDRWRRTSSALGGTSVPPTHPFLARFFEGGGRLFGRYLRLLVLTFVAGGAAEILVGGAARPALTRLAESSWEWGPIVASLASTLLLAVIVGFFVLVLDYARIRLAMTDERSALKNAYLAFRYVLNHPVATFTTGLAAACALAVVIGGSVVLQSRIPSATWASIAAVALAQQGAMLLRAGVRIAQIASEVELTSSLPGLLPASSETAPDLARVESD